MIKNILIAGGLGYGAFWLYQRYNLAGITTENEEGAGFIDAAMGGFMTVSSALNTKNNMSISLRGLAHIKGWEGFRANVYLDVAGLPTIGYGHLIKPHESFTTITEAQASVLLAKDVSSAENAVNKYVKVPLTQNQFDALVSFAFNVGNGAFANSTMLKRINAGQYIEAGYEFGRWVFITVNGVKTISAGLVNRRTADYNLYRGAA
jgi:GH24 family phage-related lysozyme (muramidase)